MDDMEQKARALVAGLSLSEVQVIVPHAEIGNLGMARALIKKKILKHFRPLLAKPLEDCVLVPLEDCVLILDEPGGSSMLTLLSRLIKRERLRQGI
jgi:hypothetical protein